MADAPIASLRTAASRDRVLRALAVLVAAPFATTAQRRAAVAAIAALHGSFGSDAHVCGAALCAMLHACAGEVAVPLADALELARAHLGHVGVVRALLRLLCLHVASAPFLNGLPRMAHLVARLIAAHDCEVVAHYGARVLLHVLSLGEGTLRAAYGASGYEDVRLACVAAAVAARHDGVVVLGGVPWRQHVLDTLAPRLRAR